MLHPRSVMALRLPASQLDTTFSAQASHIKFSMQCRGEKGAAGWAWA